MNVTSSAQLKIQGMHVSPLSNSPSTNFDPVINQITLWIGCLMNVTSFAQLKIQGMHVYPLLKSPNTHFDPKIDKITERK